MKKKLSSLIPPDIFSFQNSSLSKNLISRSKNSASFLMSYRLYVIYEHQDKCWAISVTPTYPVAQSTSTFVKRIRINRYLKNTKDNEPQYCNPADPEICLYFSFDKEYKLKCNNSSSAYPVVESTTHALVVDPDLPFACTTVPTLTRVIPLVQSQRIVQSIEIVTIYVHHVVWASCGIGDPG